MKKIIVSIAAVFSLLLPVMVHAQSGTDDANAKQSLEIARNMVLAVSGLADDFKKYKGEYVMKDKSDNSYYTINELNLGTDLQYVIVKPSGTTVVAAIYKGKDKDDKSVAMAFAAFTGGVPTLTNSKDFTIVVDDTNTDKDVLKYFLKINSTKIASFSFNIKENSGTLLVAVQ